MNLQLMQCRPDPRALATWAARHAVLSPDGDFGYALHALLSAAFGAKAPRPFRYLGGRRGLLAYTDISPEALRESAALAAPDVARALGLDSLEARRFPTAWRVGQRLGFEVRVRPVVRTKDGRERDAFLHAVEPVPRNDGSERPPAWSSGPRRAAIYGEWLRKQLSAEGAAEVLKAGLDAFRLTRVLRRPPAIETGKRGVHAISGPDVVFKGDLEVGDGQAFARLVARGVGRHRAFGFGMLLLKPAC
jgi:CRISPR system Cascade subunit CasE